MLAAAHDKIRKFEVRQRNYYELEKLQQTWYEAHVRQCLISTRGRINESQAARQLFMKIHSENERVLQLLTTTKTNLFGQKVSSVSAQIEVVRITILLQKMKREDAAAMEATALRAQVDMYSWNIAPT